ncbi:MAG TPA: sulfurtransferase TusA family protein [Acidobacteriota bacterium]|nr:sulfurtransferase TusA family protein [Acidobacteriota bacterium]
MDEELEPQEQIKLEALLCNLKQLRETRCHGCGAAICGHEALMSFTMGFKDAPKCWPCLATTMGHEKEDLRDHIFAYIRHRSCHYEGWRWASREEGFEPDSPPQCLWPAPFSIERKLSYEPPNPAPTEKSVSEIASNYDAEWNAGGMACGELVSELRARLQHLKSGQIFKLIATDSGAIEDIPAWCRLTGNALLLASHPNYLIRRTPI